MLSQKTVYKQLLLLDNLETLKHHLATQFDVIQIGRDDAGQCQWQGESHPSEPLYGPHNKPLHSPKAFFFADKEPMYRFDGYTFEAIHPAVPAQVLFGVQACDLSAISYQDQFFADDPYYQARRAQTLLVGIDCDGPCEFGFCHKVNAGPLVDQQHADLILSRYLADNESNAPWLLIVTSDKGKQSIAGLGLAIAEPQHVQTRIAHRSHILEKFKDYEYIDSVIEQINDNTIPLEVWQQLSLQCLGCSGCTNLCPTCSCYSTFEVETQPSETQLPVQTTYRNWDSCLFEGFQKEASGHNPSHEAAKRVERFWFHKFSDSYLAEFSRFGCVGCGRCEITCPGVIGVHSVFKRIEQACCN